MSTSITRTCFDIASDYLQQLQWKKPMNSAADIQSLKMEVRILETYVVFVDKGRKQEQDGNKCESLVCGMRLRIKDVVSRIPMDLDSADLKSSGDSALLETEINRQRENIKFLLTDIKELYINLVDHPYQGDAEQFMKLFDCLERLLGSLKDAIRYGAENFVFLYFRTIVLHQRLKFVRCFIENFIGFAIMRGVDRMHLTDLLIQVEMVAVNAARLIFITWFDRDIYDEEEFNKMHLEFSQVVQKIMPVDADPQLRETYIGVLISSKLSRPYTQTFSQEEENTVAADFINSLQIYLMDLLESCTTLTLSMKFQMQELNEGLRFLRKLDEQHSKFNSLDDEMKDLIGGAFIDAGIVICSLSVNGLKEGSSKETDLILLPLLEVLKSIMKEVAHIYPPTTSFGFPRTNELRSFDLLLENLQEQARYEADSIACLKDQIHLVQEDLVFLRSFLDKIAAQRNQNKNLQALWNRVMEMGYKAEVVIDSIMVGDQPGCSSISLDTITEEIKVLKTNAPEIYESEKHNPQPTRVAKTFTRMPSQVSSPSLNEVLVGLDEEVKTFIDELMRGSKQQYVVSIVGMPGLGKTTFARKVYNDTSIQRHFHILAWCIVSQVYSKRSLLLQILSNTVCQSPDQYHNKDEDDLAMELYKSLKGNRYLIVLDDVWDIEALNWLKIFFPDDENGSRILLTTRFHELCSQFNSYSKLHRLRQLTDEECWELLHNKLFGEKCFPSTLSVVGKQIAKSCKGLPLTVVIVAGILANMETDCWEEVANSLSSSTVIEDKHCMKTLELSYRHLPDYLKSCLLYFGAFPEDQDIPVRRLLQLWISEGFVQKNVTKSLEDVAEEYLMDLIGRSLVMVVEERSIGGVKACQIHDLLHEFCVTKAKEESFLHVLHGDEEIFPTAPSNPHRLCIYSVRPGGYTKPRLYFPCLRSLILFSDPITSNILFICHIFKLLRVLDIGSVQLVGENFPREVESLVYLRYLVVGGEFTSIPSGIAKLSRLETFRISRSVTAIALPNTIWYMEKLRHLCTWPLSVTSFGFKFSMDNLESFPDLYNLETLTLAIDPSSQSFQKIFRKLPNIRRLKCLHGLTTEPIQNCKGIFVMDDLGRLESLRVQRYSPPEFSFTLNLKKLTLNYNFRPWSEISAIGKLPNLEVLKLLNHSFVGKTWALNEREFPNLKFLKLAQLDIWRWTASGENFPGLEKLVLHDCRNLGGVPSCLGEISTLKMIEVRGCRKPVIHSVEQIHEEQISYGNEELKILCQKMTQRIFGEAGEHWRIGNFGLLKYLR